MSHKDPASPNKMSKHSLAGREPLDPTRDIVFKRIFGDERNKDLLIDLLNAILEGTIPAKITEVEILNPYMEKEFLDDKLPILDLKLRDQNGALYDVEMQCENEEMFAERLVYYWAKLCASQLKSGQGYQELRPVFSIVLADFRMLPGEPNYLSRFVLKEKDTNVELTDMMSIHVIELPRFGKSAETSQTALERWLTFFKEGTTLATKTLEKWQHPQIQKAIEELEHLGGDEQFRFQYEARAKRLSDINTNLRAKYEKGLEEGEAIGLEKGETIGLEKGEAIGLEKGEAIGLEKGEAIGLEKGWQGGQAELLESLARKWHQAGQSIQEIAALLGVPEEDVQGWLTNLSEPSTIE